ncbi:unnamed protein product [Hymenolepis diminuta]|uniref:Transmembrane protein 166 n=1 Tax=Hymenolepis diminuta TaxID=6216 RepID=A0A0R3SKP4_HYMDI|nr:unnamed protein product [Hymenolepis diminuta]
MGCHCHRTTCIWFWVIMAFLGVGLIASGTYFSFAKCTAANLIEIDCLIPLSFCGAGALVFILVGFGCSCLPAKLEKESQEEKKEWEEYIESVLREEISCFFYQESERSHGKPSKKRGSKRNLDDSARPHTEPDRKKKGKKTHKEPLSEALDLILEEASKHPEVIQNAAEFFAELAKHET